MARERYAPDPPMTLGNVRELGERHRSHRLLDQIAALKWVQKNIRTLADSSRVTIFGESAGAFDVSLLEESDRRLADAMYPYWTNFAKSGDLNGPGLPSWRAYKPAGKGQVMKLGEHGDADRAAPPSL